MAAKVPNVLLNTGRSMPIIGLGTWKSKPGEVESAIEAAISCGYRHLDCAFVYRNSVEVGNAIQTKIKDGSVKREDLFVVDKLWNAFHAAKDVRPSLMKTLELLQTSYLDLYLMHWPQGYANNNGELFSRDENGKVLHDDTDYLETWKELIKLQKEGLVKDIGVSNFNEYQIDRLIKETSVVPAVNQVEIHPYLTQEPLVKFCRSKNIAVTAYSPLGSADRPWAKPDEPVLLENSQIKEIAKRLNKTPAQIVIRFPIERGVIVIPKSVTPSRIQSNFDVFDFKLSEDDMKILLGFNVNFRGCPSDWDAVHKYYPFRENYSE